ncbi:MAG: DUF1569 domain-containing protein [Acidobacteria bacterium ACB2]|nr:DUF1569 domain-containing protein [Acidobacteria bacterium ACB2]
MGGGQPDSHRCSVCRRLPGLSDFGGRTVLETATGQTPRRQSLLGKLVTPFIRKMVLGEKPFQKGAPTDPTFLVPDERDFAAEKARLAGLVEALCRRGPAEAAKNPHVFFGKLSGEEWGVLTFKHLDHHLRQFGV